MNISTWRLQSKNGLSNCEYLDKYAQELRQFIESVEVDPDEPGAASEKFKKPILDWAVSKGWSLSKTIDESVIRSLPHANYKIHALLDMPECSCGQKHRLFFQLMFDNRQAIGTNLLRLDLALKNFETSDDRTGLAIGLMVDGPVKAKFRWDNSVAIGKEYEMALIGPYESLFHGRIELWTLNQG